MPSIVCPGCSREHTVEEYEEDRFCRGCGALLHAAAGRLPGRGGWRRLFPYEPYPPQIEFMESKKRIMIATNAFGMGIDRLVALAHGVDDIRNFYSGNLRFLKQFQFPGFDYAWNNNPIVVHYSVNTNKVRSGYGKLKGIYPKRLLYCRNILFLRINWRNCNTIISTEEKPQKRVPVIRSP